MDITFSTCFYNCKSKHSLNEYLEWMDNFLFHVNNFYLAIYTDDNSKNYLTKYSENKKIKIIVKPFENFFNYKYKDFWIKNHVINNKLNFKTTWEVNMIYSEKISFVCDSYKDNFFNTEMHGWCDIGYFRNATSKFWPNKKKINNLDKNKIYYALINYDFKNINFLRNIILDKNNLGLPKNQLPKNQTSIAGGFFVCHKTKLDWWHKTYDEKLKLYLENNYLVETDQTILADCIFSNKKHFHLCIEKQDDNWFMFQRYLK